MIRIFITSLKNSKNSAKINVSRKLFIEGSKHEENKKMCLIKTSHFKQFLTKITFETTLFSQSIQQHCSVFSTCFARQISVKVKPDKTVDFVSSVSQSGDQRLYCWGYAEMGALGELKVRSSKMKQKMIKRPVRKVITFTDKIVDISCGYGFTLFAIKGQTKQLFGSGLNTDCQIGYHSVRSPENPLKLIFNIVPIKVPLQFPLKTKITTVAAGRAHSIVVTDNEGVFSIGNNDFGQCGRPIIPDENYSKYRNLWKLNMDSNERIIKAVCGQEHTLLLTETGKVYSFGNGADGQTGLGHFRVTHEPTLIKGDIENEKIVKLSSTCDTVLALNDKGEIFGWGNSEYFQLLTPDFIQQIHTPKHLKLIQTLGKIKDIASAGTVSMVLTENNDVYVWGYGILGRGLNQCQAEEPSLIPKTLFGCNDFYPDTKVEAINCGVNTMAAITNTGDLYMWGKNNVGQLGLGHKEDQYYPLKVSLGALVRRVICGLDHTMALCKPFI